MKEFKRIPLKINVEFLPEGGFLPMRVIYEEKNYDIDKILKVKKHCPQTVGCISPVEYTVFFCIRRNGKKSRFKRKSGCRVRFG